MKLIYRLFLDGYTFHSIARELTSRGLETPARKKRWYPGTVESILTNEKYKGDALLQKRFTVNFLTKETKANEGEVPQYYVENNHEAIISPQVFDWVQEEIKRRREGRGRYSGVSIFSSSKIKCGQCGGWYGAKVWHSTDKYRRTIYRCNDKFKSHCKTPHLTEDDIKEAFVRAVNQLIENKADVLDSITLLKERLTDTEDLEEERDRISTDLNLLADKIQQLIAENARVAQNQDDYDRTTTNWSVGMKQRRRSTTRPVKPSSIARPGAVRWTASSRSLGIRISLRSSMPGCGAAWWISSQCTAKTISG